MIDYLEKVRIITALKNCLDRPKCRDCPWHECGDALGDDCVIPRSLADKAMEALMNVEPKRGQWVKNGPPVGITRYKCSVCGSGMGISFQYCPCCGARMEGDETDEQVQET